MPESTGLREVWQLDHDGYGRTLHATVEHAKAYAEAREAGGTYWRWDEDYYRLKRDGETFATIRRVPVLGDEGEQP